MTTWVNMNSRRGFLKGASPFLAIAFLAIAAARGHRRIHLSGSGFLTTAKYATLATCSPDTAQRDIKELVERGALGQNAAGGRSTSYPLPDRIDPRSSTSCHQPRNPESS